MSDFDYSARGYIAKGVGVFEAGLAAAIPFINILAGDPSSYVSGQRAASLAILGGVCYFIGDRMHCRELEEYRISLLERQLEGVDDIQDRGQSD